MFACYPDDTVKKIRHVKKFKKKANLQKYDELAPQIQGHLIKLATNFLSEQKFRFKGLIKDN